MMNPTESAFSTPEVEASSIAHQESSSVEEPPCYDATPQVSAPQPSSDASLSEDGGPTTQHSSDTTSPSSPTPTSADKLLELLERLLSIEQVRHDDELLSAMNSRMLLPVSALMAHSRVRPLRPSVEDVVAAGRTTKRFVMEEHPSGTFSVGPYPQAHPKCRCTITLQRQRSKVAALGKDDGTATDGSPSAPTMAELLPSRIHAQQLLGMSSPLRVLHLYHCAESDTAFVTFEDPGAAKEAFLELQRKTLGNPPVALEVKVRIELASHDVINCSYPMTVGGASSQSQTGTPAMGSTRRGGPSSSAAGASANSTGSGVAAPLAGGWTVPPAAVPPVAAGIPTMPPAGLFMPPLFTPQSLMMAQMMMWCNPWAAAAGGLMNTNGVAGPLPGGAAPLPFGGGRAGGRTGVPAAGPVAAAARGPVAPRATGPSVVAAPLGLGAKGAGAQPTVSATPASNPMSVALNRQYPSSAAAPAARRPGEPYRTSAPDAMGTLSVAHGMRFDTTADGLPQPGSPPTPAALSPLSPLDADLVRQPLLTGHAAQQATKYRFEPYSSVSRKLVSDHHKSPDSTSLPGATPDAATIAAYRSALRTATGEPIPIDSADFPFTEDTVATQQWTAVPPSSGSPVVDAPLPRKKGPFSASRGRDASQGVAPRGGVSGELGLAPCHQNRRRTRGVSEPSVMETNHLDTSKRVVNITAQEDLFPPLGGADVCSSSPASHEGVSTADGGPKKGGDDAPDDHQRQQRSVLADGGKGGLSYAEVLRLSSVPHHDR